MAFIFENLKVYQKAVDFAEQISNLTDNFPRGNYYIVDQINRAALSIPFGDPAISDMDDYFIAHGQEQTGANNIVTSIVFDFRAFDTLGEACVMFTAVFGVSVLFRLRKKGEDYEYE